jgi:hypothetical protein
MSTLSLFLSDSVIRVNDLGERAVFRRHFFLIYFGKEKLKI